MNKSEFRTEINRYTNRISNYSFNNDFFAKWWFLAFPDNRDVDYMIEWVEKFRKGCPSIYMDLERTRAYIKVIKDWNGINQGGK